MRRSLRGLRSFRGLRGLGRPCFGPLLGTTPGTLNQKVYGLETLSFLLLSSVCALLGPLFWASSAVLSEFSKLSALRLPPRAILASPWSHFGAISGHHGLSWGHLGLNWAVLWPSWSHLGPSWDHVQPCETI